MVESVDTDTWTIAGTMVSVVVVVSIGLEMEPSPSDFVVLGVSSASKKNT